MKWLAVGLHGRSRLRLPILLGGVLFATGRRTAARAEPRLLRRPCAGGQTIGHYLAASAITDCSAGPVPLDRRLAATRRPARIHVAPPALCRGAKRLAATRRPARIHVAPPARGRCAGGEGAACSGQSPRPPAQGRQGRGRRERAARPVTPNHHVHRHRAGGGVSMERKTDNSAFPHTSGFAQPRA